MQTRSKSMLATSPVYPDVPAKDWRRARQFYENTLGLDITEVPQGEQAGMFIVQTGQGSMFLVYQTDAKDEATVASWVVPDVQGCYDDLAQRGVQFEKYDLPGTTWDGDIANMGGQNKGFWFKDTEGNVFSVVQGM